MLQFIQASISDLANTEPEALVTTSPATDFKYLPLFYVGLFKDTVG